MANVVLSDATPADAAGMAAIIRAGFEEYRGVLDPPSGAHDDSAETVAHYFTDGGGGVLAFVGESAEPVGCILYQRNQAKGYVYMARLAVLPAHRGRGVARALVEYVEAKARAWGVPQTTLGVRVMLPHLRERYERMGYTQLVRWGYHDGYAEPTWVLLGKNLTDGLPSSPHPCTQGRGPG